MKKIILLIALAMYFLPAANAQDIATKPKLSAFTQQYLHAHKQQAGNNTPIQGYVYKQINNKPYISAFIKVAGNVDESTLTALGVLTGTKAGKIWTVQIPLESMYALTAAPGISYIAVDQPVFPLLDSARRLTHADSAQKGINLPATVTGRGVVTGIIDAGFDFNHPTMYDTTHTAYRIKRVWTQKRTGTPPTGFAYGNEMTDTNVIRAAGYDTAILSHGSHVTGIVAGSGYGGSADNTRFRGMSYESDIALVGIMPAPSEWTVAGETDIIDGLNYIFGYATSVGKPAVVNLSWGSTLGPHDGNSLFNQSCDALTGPGKIFVCAAGNNGQDLVHLGKTFTAASNSVSTFVTFSPYLDADHQATWVDVWGDTGKVFCLNIRLYSGSDVIDSTGDICISDTTHTYYLIGSNADTCTVTITMAASEYNGKPHAFISIASKVPDNICLTAKATDGKINMWEGYVLPPEGYYGYLESLGYPFAVSGDLNMTVSDIGCTRSAITTGAYVSKPSYVNMAGTGLGWPGAIYGKTAPFTSLGPTEDGRIKPDITAPGLMLGSSVCSYDTTFNTTGSNYPAAVASYADAGTGRTYLYAMFAGTSMASPCAAGIVGMMLQINPTLTPDEAKAIINATAIKDSYTGVLPATGTNKWGHGKINAYGAVSYMVQQESVKNVNMSPLDCILFPNPNKGAFSINYTGKIQEVLSVTISDVTGNVVSTQNWAVNKGGNSKSFSQAEIAKGIYFTKISSKTGYNVIKMIVE